MRKMTWITGVLTCLMALLTALGCALGAVRGIATDESLYGAQSRAAVMLAQGFETEEQVTAYIGMDQARQGEAARELAAFMRGEEAKLDFLGEDERTHMLDVRALVSGMAGMSKTYLALAAALAVAAAWTGARVRRRVRAQLAGGLTAVGLIMLVVVSAVNQIRSAGFAAAFVAMHEALFANDLWLMDPATDILIRMMPQQLFEQALLNGANLALRMTLVAWLLLLAAQGIVSGMIRRHMTKEERA